MDTVDQALIHALQIDGRAPFRAIADVLEVSENTVARRYRRLRGQGVLRVVGLADGRRLGYVQWTIRLSCTPDAAVPVARAIAAREDTSFVYLLSGGTEVSCTVQTRTPADQDALLLDKLPRTTRIVSVSAHLLLRAFVLPSDRRGLTWLSADQADRLRPPPADSEGPVDLDDGAKALLRALNRTGARRTPSSPR